jgi:hypothetical protein
VLEQQAKAAEQRQIQRDQTILAKNHANAAASGLVASSGSPFSTAIDSTTDLQTNAAAARYPGRVDAWAKRSAAQNAYAGIPSMVFETGQSLLKDRGSVLGSLMQPADKRPQNYTFPRMPSFIYGGDPLAIYKV